MQLTLKAVLCFARPYSTAHTVSQSQKFSGTISAPAPYVTAKYSHTIPWHCSKRRGQLMLRLNRASLHRARKAGKLASASHASVAASLRRFEADVGFCSSSS